MNKILKPLFKYPGGKGKEYKHFKWLFPAFDNYVEPFLGGGAVYWATNANHYVINDYSKELVNVYKFSENQNQEFLDYLTDICIIWDNKLNQSEMIKNILIEKKNISDEELKIISTNLFKNNKNLPSNKKKMQKFLKESILRKQKSLLKISYQSEINNWQENALGVLGSTIYTYLRDIYNHTSIEINSELKTAIYLYLREYSYSSMFRYNSEGFFNVPFGGNTYAKKDFKTRLNQIKSNSVIKKLKQTNILQGDFSEAFIDEKNTFMFLDPPYDSEFSTYNLHVFDAIEQIRLKNELMKIKKTKWLMVVKSTDFIENLYDEKGWYKIRFDKSYAVNFKNRNDQNVKHLIITNYPVGDEYFGNN